jgi:hypothetical protein
MSLLPHSGSHKPATLENQTHVCDIYGCEWPEDEGPRHVSSHMHGDRNKLHPLIVHRTRCTRWPSSTRLHRQCELLYALSRADCMQDHTLLHFRQYRHIN